MSSSNPLPANPPREPTALDAWLREQLGRQLTLAALVPYSTGSDAFTALHAQLALYTEVRLVDLGAEPTATALQVEQLLTPIARLDPDILLVWIPSPYATTPGTASGPTMPKTAPDAAAPASWPRSVLVACERLGLLDHCYAALLGPDITRATARALGFEDGFPASLPVPDLLAALSREAIARDAYRRRGSSPPCFL